MLIKGHISVLNLTSVTHQISRLKNYFVLNFYSPTLVELIAKSKILWNNKNIKAQLHKSTQMQREKQIQPINQQLFCFYTLRI